MLSEYAYEQLRERLVRLRFRPGVALHEDELMRELDIGRTPLREAVKRLALEGLIETRPSSGTYVARVEASDIVQIAELRAELESYAAGLAAERMDDTRRAAAGILRGELARIEHSAVTERYMAFDERVHRFVWDSADNHYLAETLDRLYALSLRIWHLVIDEIPDVCVAVREHDTLLGKLIAGDAQAAASLMRGHIELFEAAVTEAFGR